MTDSVLSHRSAPAIDSCKQRFHPQPDYLTQLFANSAGKFFVRCLQNLFITRPANEAAEQCAIIWSAMRELVMYESGSEHALAFTAGDEESEPGRKSVADFPIVAEIYSDGRSVLYASEFGRQFCTCGSQ